MVVSKLRRQSEVIQDSQDRKLAGNLIRSNKKCHVFQLIIWSVARAALLRPSVPSWDDAAAAATAVTSHRTASNARQCRH